MTATTSTIEPTRARDLLAQNLTRVVKLPAETVEPLLCALVAGGHALVEGIPGVGKTLLARALAACVDGAFRRVQFTNDLMPSDVLGTSVWQQDTGTFRFVPGPLFANVVLADEINRTSPRTLSCLLEAMESGSVSVDGRTEQLGAPFMVLATRNPIEFHGTFPVPEAALDRFLVRVELDYPSPEDELQLYVDGAAEQRLEQLQPVMDLTQLLDLQRRCREVTVRPPVAEYALRVAQATRAHPQLQLGASPRAALAWLSAAKARALLDGRDYVLPDDLKATATAALSHRLSHRHEGDTAAVIGEVLEAVAVPL